MKPSATLAGYSIQPTELRAIRPRHLTHDSQTMTLDSETRFERFASIGMDAVPLDRYSDLVTADSELIIYDERWENGRIQSTVWIPAETME